MNWTLVEWLFYNQGCQGRTTQSLMRGVEKRSSQEATLLGVIHKRRGISQAWRSYPRSKGLKPHTEHPSFGSSTRKWAPLPGLKTSEADWRAIKNQDPVLKTRKTDWLAPNPTQNIGNCPMFRKALREHCKYAPEHAACFCYSPPSSGTAPSQGRDCITCTGEKLDYLTFVAVTSPAADPTPTKQETYHCAREKLRTMAFSLSGLTLKQQPWPKQRPSLCWGETEVAPVCHSSASSPHFALNNLRTAITLETSMAPSEFLLQHLGPGSCLPSGHNCPWAQEKPQLPPGSGSSPSNSIPTPHQGSKPQTEWEDRGVLSKQKNKMKPQSKFPRWLTGKEYACQCRRHRRCGFNPWVRRSPWGRNENPFQYSCLENSIQRRAGGLQSMGSQRVRHNRATEYAMAK